MSGDSAYGGLRQLMQPLRRFPLHPQWLLGGNRAATAWLRANARGDVLDVGCADRWAANALGTNCSYLGLDSVSTGQHWYASKPDVFSDASYLPFNDNSFDTVLLLDVAEHLVSPSAAFKSISRVLRPGGILLLSIPFLYPIHDAPHDYQRYTSHGLQREMHSAGLHVDVLLPSLGAVETAGLLMCLALAGMAAESLRQRRATMILMPLIALLIPIINVLSWSAGKVLPTWDALPAGYRLLARKP